MNGTRAVFAGSFDPPTLGHLDIIRRSSALYEKLFIVIAVNPDKTCLLTPQERQSLLCIMTEDIENAEVCIWNGYSVDFAQEHGADVMIRGVRNINDFKYEYDMACTNRILNPFIQTVFFPSLPEFANTSSSLVKEKAAKGEDISKLVPECVRLILTEKFKVLT